MALSEFEDQNDDINNNNDNYNNDDDDGNISKIKMIKLIIDNWDVISEYY